MREHGCICPRLCAMRGCILKAESERQKEAEKVATPSKAVTTKQDSRAISEEETKR